MSRAPSRATGRRRIVGALAAVVSSLLFAIGSTAVPAAAAGEHHAGVVVDTGSGVHVEVVTFTEDSISGLEALQRAGADPSVLGFSGIGGAVCSLYGVGHPATSSTCLGEASDPRYWAYWHVPEGQSGFDQSTYSRAAATSVRVHDGDVEGWRFGTGDPPEWPVISFPETPPATAASSGGGNPAGGGTGTPGDSGAPSTGPSVAAPTTSSTLSPEGWAAIAALKAASSTTTPTTSTTRPGTTKNGKDTQTEVATKRASAMHDSGDGSGSVLSFAAFAVVLLLLAAGIFFARRARVGRSAGPS